MKIALFTDTYLPQKNGVAVAVAQLKDELTELGHEVYVYTVNIPGCSVTDEDKVIRSKAVAVPNLGADENLWALPNRLRTLRHLRKNQIEVIHTHTELPQGLLGRYCAKILKIPHIHTVHTMWSDYRHYLLNGKLLTEKNVAIAYHLFLRKITAVIAPSQKAQNFLANINIKSVRINNGVDAKHFYSCQNQEKQTALKETLEITEGDKVILFVGRLAPEKRIVDLFKTMVEVVKAANNVKILLIGDGVDAPFLKEEAQRLNLANHFIFAGRIEHQEMVNYYAIADLYVTVSLSEVQPMTLIEALLTGLPIISRQDVAYNGLVEDGCNGFQCVSDSEVQQKILDILHNSEQYLCCREGSLQLSENFTAKMNAKKTLSLYEQALSAGRPDRFHKGPLLYDNDL